jgi:hypothetical protein
VIPDANDIASCQRFIRHLADTRHVRISRHAQEEMDAEFFDQRDVLGCYKRETCWRITRRTNGVLAA